MTFVRVVQASTDRTLLPSARLCDSFICKLRGLTFRRSLEMRDSLILVESSDGVARASITMLFVFFPIAVIWINSAGNVVDAQLARPFRLMYVPAAPARYMLEGPPELLQLLQFGDQVRFEPLAS